MHTPSQPQVSRLVQERSRLPSSLRLKLILTAFVAALVVSLGGVTMALVSRIFGKLAPPIQADLSWKAQREAEELAQTSELGLVMRDEGAIAAQLASSARVPDVMGARVVDETGKTLARTGALPPDALPFSAPARTAVSLPGSVTAWAPVLVESRQVGKVAVFVSTERVQQLERLRVAVLSTAGVASLLAVIVSVFFVSTYLGPLLALTQRALGHATELAADLETRVLVRTHELEQANQRLQESLARVHDTQAQLVEASRKAGMADVATAVLHNVGNVLNNVNIASGVIADGVRRSRGTGLSRVADLLEAADVRAALAGHGKASLVPRYVRELASQLDEERSELLCELNGLQRNVDHIKVIVGMQQAHAKTQGGVFEPISLRELVEEALTMNSLSNQRHRIAVVRELADVPPALLDRHKVFQIVMNLMSNARHAILSSERGEGAITLRLAQTREQDLALEIEDTGCGIPAENMGRIFNHGFTTKPDGHGFGLHSSACAAAELGGTLSCRSPGVGRGATFTLKLPVRRMEAAA